MDIVSKKFMAQNTLTLDPKNPAFMDALKGCMEGDEETFKVTGTVLRNGNQFVLDVSKVEYEEGEGADETAAEDGKEEGDGENLDEGTAEMPMKKPMKANPGIAIILGAKK